MIGKKIIIYFACFTLLTLLNFNVYAEDLDDLAGFSIIKDPSKKCTNYIKDKGFLPGKYKEIGGQKIMLICGSAEIKASPSQKIFIDSRQVGYEEAILKAKANYAEAMGEYIGSKVTNIGEQGALSDEMDREREISLSNEGSKLMDKLIALAHNEIDHILNERGVEDPTKQSQVVKEEVKKMINSVEFRKVVKTFANSQLAGLQVNKVFEDCEKGDKQCEIALAMAWSENSAALANSLFNSIPSIAPKGGIGKPITERIPKKNEDVLSNIGPRLYLDENGNYHIIAIATSMPKSDTKTSKNMAKDIAATLAKSYIRQFASETTGSARDLIQAQNYKELVDSSVDIIYDDGYNLNLRSISETRKIQGIVPLEEGYFIHPAKPESKGVWVAMIWTPASMSAAQETKKVIENKSVEEEELVEEETKSENTEIDTSTEIESESSDF